MKTTKILILSLIILISLASATETSDISIDSPEPDFHTDEEFDLVVDNDEKSVGGYWKLEGEDWTSENNLFTDEGGGETSYTESDINLNDEGAVEDGEYEEVVIGVFQSDAEIEEEYLEDSVNIHWDEVIPEIESIEPETNANISETFNVEVDLSEHGYEEALSMNVSKSKDGQDLGSDSEFQDNLDFDVEITTGSGDSDDLDTGDYLLEVEVTNDLNSETDSREIVIDLEDPEFAGTVDFEDEFVNQTIFIEENFENIESGLQESSYAVMDGDDEAIGGMNFGEDEEISELTSGESYSIHGEYTDYAGNSNTETITSEDFTADFEQPEIDLDAPSSGRINVSSDFLVDGNFSVDNDLSQLSASETLFLFESRDEIILEDIVADEGSSEFLSDTEEVGDFGFAIENVHDGRINFMYDVSGLEDGVYDAEILVSDKAGNSVVEGFEVGVSSNAPDISDVEYEGVGLENDGFVGSSGNVSLDFGWGGVAPENRSYRWVEDGGDDDWIDFDGSDFDFDLAEGNYTLEIFVEDYLGNNGTESFENITVDDSPPEASIQRLTEDGWRNSHEVELVCEQDGSPVEETGVLNNEDEIVQGWDDGTSQNYTINQHGENTYQFACRDQVGLENNQEQTLQIDNKNPGIASFYPEESETNANTSITLQTQINETTTLSGINETATYTNISHGNITNTEIEEQTINTEVELPFEQQITLTGQITDQLDNTIDFENTFTTRDEPEDWTTIAETTNKTQEMTLGVATAQISQDTGTINLDIEQSTSIKKLQLNRNQSGESDLMIVEDRNKPDTIEERTGETYIYTAIEPREIKNENITSANLTFEIEEEWINDIDLEEPEYTVEKFNSNNEEWETLNTTTENTTENFQITAETESFSWFAVGTTEEQIGVTGAIRQEIQEAQEADLQNYITIFLILFITSIIIYLLYQLGYIKFDIINLKIPTFNK